MFEYGNCNVMMINVSWSVVYIRFHQVHAKLSEWGGCRVGCPARGRQPGPVAVEAEATLAEWHIVEIEADSAAGVRSRH